MLGVIYAKCCKQALNDECCYENVLMLSDFKLSGIMLSVIMLSVIMLSVVAAYDREVKVCPTNLLRS
jgi:hypothetical protein